MSRIRGERLRLTRMAKRFDGSGVVRIQCSEGAFARMKLENMPRPIDWGWESNGYHYAVMDTRSVGADSERYRVMWLEPAGPASKKGKTSSFTLAGAHVNETLYVLAEFLRDQGVEFCKLTNKHGAGLKDARLSGSDLAYLSGDIPHSPACHVGFISADAPELSGSPRGSVPDTSLNL